MDIFDAGIPSRNQKRTIIGYGVEHEPIEEWVGPDVISATFMRYFTE